jgi:pimeloyl-ACP methyl ester carboxylesterase
MHIAVQGIQASYTRHQNGKKTVLCLHGWGDSSESYAKLARDLKGFDVACLDLPGFGGSEAPPNIWGLNDYIVFVADFIRELKLDVFMVIGHANGGALAIRGLADNYFTAEKLVLLSSAGIYRPNSFRNSALRVVAKSGKLILHIMPEKAHGRVKESFTKRIGSNFMVSGQMKETFRRVVRDDVLEDAHKILQPTCLIYGDRDHATPQAYGALFADTIHDSQFHVLQGTGHFVHLEQPEEVAKIITAFAS